jgi:uncharacterized protein
MFRPALLAAMLSSPLLAQTPLQQTLPNAHAFGVPPTTLSVSAEGKVEQAPDVADIQTGVLTQATTASEAMRQNADRMSRVVTALKKAGVESRDIQTSGLNLNAQYRYADNQPPQLVGYQAVNNVSVRVRDLPKMGRIIDTLVGEGANQINGPSFRLDKPEPALDLARANAVKTARDRAQLYASAAGMRVKRILSISESGAYAPPPYPMPMVRAQSMMKESADTPVAPGEVSMTVNVNVTFELE